MGILLWVGINLNISTFWMEEMKKKLVTENVKWAKCIQMMLDGSYTQKQIAEVLNITQATIINWKNTLTFKSRNSKLKEKVLKCMSQKLLIN